MLLAMVKVCVIFYQITFYKIFIFGKLYHNCYCFVDLKFLCGAVNSHSLMNSKPAIMLENSMMDGYVTRYIYPSNALNKTFMESDGIGQLSRFWKKSSIVTV